MLSDTPLLKELKAVESLKGRNFQATWWSKMTADEAYEYDAGVEDFFRRSPAVVGRPNAAGPPDG